MKETLFYTPLTEVKKVKSYVISESERQMQRSFVSKTYVYAQIYTVISPKCFSNWLLGKCLSILKLTIWDLKYVSDAILFIVLVIANFLSNLLRSICYLLRHNQTDSTELSTFMLCWKKKHFGIISREKPHFEMVYQLIKLLNV